MRQLGRATSASPARPRCDATNGTPGPSPDDRGRLPAAARARVADQGNMESVFRMPGTPDKITARPEPTGHLRHPDRTSATGTPDQSAPMHLLPTKENQKGTKARVRPLPDSHSPGHPPAHARVGKGTRARRRPSAAKPPLTSAERRGVQPAPGRRRYGRAGVAPACAALADGPPTGGRQEPNPEAGERHPPRGEPPPPPHDRRRPATGAARAATSHRRPDRPQRRGAVRRMAPAPGTERATPTGPTATPRQRLKSLSGR